MQIREARLILPNTPEAHHVAMGLRRDLSGAFGGYTETLGSGGWVAPSGDLIAEPVRVFDVAMFDTPENAATLRVFAERVRIAANQQAVYLRLPNGNVEFVTALAAETKAA